jgi:hypothetical protein
MRKNELWFGAKTYGYGWTPITWQGWLVVGIYLVLVIGLSTYLEPGIEYFGLTFLATATLVWISAKKGEKARWRWGK